MTTRNIPHATVICALSVVLLFQSACSYVFVDKCDGDYTWPIVDLVGGSAAMAGGAVWMMEGGDDEWAFGGGLSLIFIGAGMVGFGLAGLINTATCDDSGSSLECPTLAAEAGVWQQPLQPLAAESVGADFQPESGSFWPLPSDSFGQERGVEPAVR